MANSPNRITPLSQSVVEKIAAGEVVERPASVVKEIIENAIDARASRIDIVIEDAGFSLISVSDNGTGIPADQLVLAVTPHATSKITSFDDLYALSTLGFRGEALASMASVSRFTLVSAADNSGQGNSLSGEGGIVGEITPVGRGRGTTVICRDLFYNVPARKKFLKTQRAEQSTIVHLCEQLVVPYPAIHFTLTVDGKKMLDMSPVDSVRSRIAQVTGTDWAKKMIECRGEIDGAEALVYLSQPDEFRTRPRFTYLYVNLRRVDCDTVTFAIRDAFARFVSHQFRPSFFCFIDIDASRIDVNVHPTKQKIKFENEKSLFGFLHSTIERGIEKQMPKLGDVQKPVQREGFGIISGGSSYGVAPSRVSEYDTTVQSTESTNIPGEYASAVQEAGLIQDPVVNTGYQTSLLFSVSHDASAKNIAYVEEQNVQSDISDRGEPWSLVPCFQIHDMYILLPIKNGVMLIDQHAAHERILFEKAIDNLELGGMEAQHLLFPIVMELSPAEKNIVESGDLFLNRLGFEIGDFGGTAIAVRAIPAFLKDSDTKRAISEIIDYLLDEKTVRAFPEPQMRFAAAFACGAAIKAGQRLGKEEMNALVNNLFAAQNPYTCPHGRPTVVRISLDELARRFLRTAKE